MFDHKILALDFDGVISNPYHLKLKYINDFGYNIQLNECTYGLCVKTNKVDPLHYKIANEKALSAGPAAKVSSKKIYCNFKEWSSNEFINRYYRFL